MPSVRVMALAGGHALVAACCAELAQGWLSVADGRAAFGSLVSPAIGGFPGLGWAAAAAGAALGPLLHRGLSRIPRDAKRPALMAAVVGVVYALAVMVASTALWMPWVMVIGRAPGDSIASALGGALFVIGFGMPMFAFAGALLFAPVLVLGGAAVGVAAMSIERRYLPTIS